MNAKTSNGKSRPNTKVILHSVPLAKDAPKAVHRDHVDYDRDPEFQAGYLKAAFVDDVCAAMHEMNITKSALAERLGKSRQYVTRVLNESANFTIDSMAEIATALGRQLTIRVHPSAQGATSTTSTKSTSKPRIAHSPRVAK
ncbi:MAG: helix-turn-helix transcriptional regulator [Candidatus Hydrogenedentales bacterium]|jgi:DNA-binding phage protein